MNLTLDTIVATFLTLGIFTLAYKENPLYRFTEHLFVGTAMGYSIVVGYRNIRDLGVNRISGGDFMYIIPFILGLMMYSRFFGRNYQWISRIPVSLLLGSSIGISMRAIPSTQIFNQLKATFNPLTNINNIVLLAAFVFSLIYFTFTVKLPEKINTPVLNLGKYFIMVYMGALYGNVIIHRASLLVSRFQYILFDVLQLA